MPHEWNNIWVVTKDELVPKYYTWEQLKLTIWRYEGKPYGIKRVQRACNNRPMLVSFDSLPIEIQNAIGDPRKVDSILERYYKIDPDAVTFYTTVKVGVKGTLETEKQEEYIINASVLQAAIKLKKARELERVSKGITIRGLMATISSDVNGFNKVLRAKYGIEHTLQSSARKFEETYNEFVKNGYGTLLSKKYNNRNAVKNTDEIKALLESMFVSQKHKPTPTEVSRQYEGFLNGYVEIINNETGEVYNPKDFKKLSKRCITSFLASWGSKVVTYSKRGGDRQKHLEQFIPYYDMKQPEYAGSMVSVDDRQPPFEYAPNERVWFYNAVDLGSECLTTWVYGVHKKGVMADFYRQMVRNYAEWGLPLPAELECESNLNSALKDTLLRDGVMFQHVHIEANNPRGKRCERYWRGFRYEKEKKKEGWQARPFAKSEPNQVSSHKVPLIPYEKIVEGCLLDIQEHNNSPHSNTKKYPGKSRWEVFLENQHPSLKPINYKSFLRYLGYKTETSCNAGTIRLQAGKYWLGDDGEIYTGQRLIELLKVVDGKELDVYWIDGNDGQVLKALVYLRGSDRCVCEAIVKPVCVRATIEKTADGKSAEEITARYIATVNGYVSGRKKAIDKVTVIDNRTAVINNKFKIRGLNSLEIKESSEVEILDQEQSEGREFEYDPNAVQPSFKKELVEIF